MRSRRPYTAAAAAATVAADVVIAALVNSMQKEAPAVSVSSLLLPQPLRVLLLPLLLLERWIHCNPDLRLGELPACCTSELLRNP